MIHMSEFSESNLSLFVSTLQYSIYIHFIMLTNSYVIMFMTIIQLSMIMNI